MDSTWIPVVLFFALFGGVYVTDVRRAAEKVAWERKAAYRQDYYRRMLEAAIENIDPALLEKLREREAVIWEKAHEREDGILDLTRPNLPPMPPIDV